MFNSPDAFPCPSCLQKGIQPHYAFCPLCGCELPRSDNVGFVNASNLCLVKWWLDVYSKCRAEDDIDRQTPEPCGYLERDSKPFDPHRQLFYETSKLDDRKMRRMQMSTIARIVRYRPKLKLDMEYSAYWVKGLLERIDELMVLSHPDKCDEAFAHDTFCNLNSLRARVQQIAKALRWQV